MSRLDSLRGKIPRRPSRAGQRTDQARRRPRRQDDPALAAAGRALSDVREVFGDVPRDADPDHLVRRARRLVRQAALDEFAREGVTLVQLPEQWGRAELRRADVPGDAAFQEFVGEVLAAIDIAPSPLERDDAIELLHAPSSTDPYGLSLEVAADLASYLLSRAWVMERGARAAATTGSSAPAGAAASGAGVPTDAGPSSVAGADESLGRDAAIGLPTQDEFVAGHATGIRDEVRGALVRVVKVPLELKEAHDKHRRVQERKASGEKAAPEPTVTQSAPTVRTSRAGRLGSSGGTGTSSSGLPFGFGGGSASSGSAGAGSSASGSGSAGASGGRTTTGSAWTGSSAGGSSSSGTSSADDSAEDGAPRRSIAEQVAALHGFATSETGRKTFDVMRTVGERAFDLYQHREASREGGDGSGSAGGSRSKKRPPST